jgi:Anti-sigma factor NepR
VVKPVEQETQQSAAPLPKGESIGSLNRPGTGNGSESRSPAAVTTLPRARARKTEPKPQIVEQIGLRLRSVYNEVLFQPVPDRFHDLLATLESGLPGETEAPAAKADSGRKKDSK